jgi:hypothetical protein
LVGSDLGNLKYLGGYKKELQDTKELGKIKELHRDLITNLPSHLLPLDRGERTIGGGPGGRRCQGFGELGSAVRWGIERGEGGELKYVLTGGG